MSPFAVKDWRDRPDQTTPVDAAGLEDLETRLGRSGSANTVDADVLSSPSADTENAFVVKSPSDTWGTGAYGTGQAFMLLKQGSGAVEPDDSVLWRVDEDGDMGVGGGIHVATDLRKDTGDPASTQAVWIDPADDMVLLVLDPHSSQTHRQITWNRPDASLAGDITKDGHVELYDTAGTTALLAFYAGDSPPFGARAIMQAVSGGASATIPTIHHVGFEQFVEMADPNAAGTNQARLFARDNGSGKTQLCVQFNTGTPIVIATQA